MGEVKPDAPVRVVRVSPAQWSKNFQTKAERRRLARLTPAERKAEAVRRKLAKKAKEKKAEQEKKKTAVKPDRQVVNVPPTADDSEPKNARFMSKYNTNVKKETVARLDERDPRKRRVTNKLQEADSIGKTSKPSLKTPNLTLKGDDLDQDILGRPKKGKAALQLPNILRRDKVKLGFGIDDDPLAVANRTATKGLLGNSDRFELNLGSALGDDDGEKAGKKGRKAGVDKPKVPTLSALIPTIGRAGRLSGSPSMDHIEGIAEGDGTFLNTKEFRYATFIHRVSDSVYPYWDSFLHTEYRRRDPTRRIYGQRDRATVVRMELNLSGEVEALHVAESSGVDFLDDVIVKAIRKAGPFPNPPSAMADEDGVIRLSYRFVVVLRPSRGSLFRGLR